MTQASRRDMFPFGGRSEAKPPFLGGFTRKFSCGEKHPDSFQMVFQNLVHAAALGRDHADRIQIGKSVFVNVLDYEKLCMSKTPNFGAQGAE